MVSSSCEVEGLCIAYESGVENAKNGIENSKSGVENVESGIENE